MRKRIGLNFGGTLGTLVGSTFVHRLTDHTERAPLRIGSQVWSTHQLASQLGRRAHEGGPPPDRRRCRDGGKERA